MKKSILILMLAVSICSFAQNKKLKSIKNNNIARSSSVLPPSGYYTFSTYTASYQSITGNTVSAGQKWDELIYQIPMGFNFKIYNTQNDTINYNGGSVMTFDDINTANNITAANAMFEDLCDRAFDPSVDTDGDPGGISPITYTTVGTPGNRICKIEVSNAGFYSEISANSASTSFVNFQTWLYEGSNDVEFRFGNCSIASASDCFYDPNGFGCGLFDSLDVNTAATVNSNVLSGPFANPTMVVLNPNFTDVITGTMQTDRVYKFTHVNLVTNIKNNAKANSIALYPNPAKDKLYISNISNLNNATIEFYDVAGKQIHSEKLNTQIDLSSFNKGIYLVKIHLEKGENVFVNKIVITD